MTDFAVQTYKIWTAISFWWAILLFAHFLQIETQTQIIQRNRFNQKSFRLSQTSQHNKA